MDITTQELKVQKVREKVEQIIHRHGLEWEDIAHSWYRGRETERHQSEADKAWEAVKGMWAKKKIDPIKYQRKIRKDFQTIKGLRIIKI